MYMKDWLWICQRGGCNELDNTCIVNNFVLNLERHSKYLTLPEEKRIGPPKTEDYEEESREDVTHKTAHSENQVSSWWA